MKELPQDEETVSSRIFKAMESKSAQSNDLILRRLSFERAVSELRSLKTPVFYLHEEGQDLEKVIPTDSESIGIILGDHVGLDATSERLLDSLEITRVSIGPRSYLSSSCIQFVNAFLDSIED